MKNNDFENIVSKKLGLYSRNIEDPDHFFETIHQKLNTDSQKKRPKIILLYIVGACIIGINILGYSLTVSGNGPATARTMANPAEKSRSKQVKLNQQSIYLKEYASFQPHQFMLFKGHEKITIDLLTNNPYKTSQQKTHVLTTHLRDFEFKNNGGHLYGKKPVLEDKNDLSQEYAIDLETNRILYDTTRQQGNIPYISREKINFISPAKNSYQPVFYQPVLALHPLTYSVKQGNNTRFSIFWQTSFIGTKNILDLSPAINPNSLDNLYLQQRKNEDRFMLGIQTGIGARLRIKKHFTVTFGMEYSVYQYNQNINNTGPFVSSSLPGEYIKSAELLELPVTAGFRIPIGRAEIDIDMGVSPSFTLFASYYSKLPGSNTLEGREGWFGNGTPQFRSFNLHLIGNILFNYSLNESWKIFAGFTSRSALLSVFNTQNTISQNYWGVGGKVGLEYEFRKKTSTRSLPKYY